MIRVFEDTLSVFNKRLNYYMYVVKLVMHIQGSI